MSLKDIKIQSSYETGANPYQLINDFYIPVLQESVEYFRISGYFNSNALTIAAKGIEALINNGGSMKLLISPNLSKEDLKIIREYGIDACQHFTSLTFEEYPEDHLMALAWLLSNKRLEIKIVIPASNVEALFHEKIGFFFDDDKNIVSFSGSVNETAAGWMKNVEEFKVFRSWDKTQNEEYLQKDLCKFISFWNDLKRDVAQVYDLPNAVKNDLLKIAPDDIWELSLMNRYRSYKVKGVKQQGILEGVLSLFPHQKRAVQWWIKNQYNSMFIMATGTGKTRTAIGCILEKLKDNEPLLVIVSTPQTMLSEQWKNEFADLEVPISRRIMVDGTGGEKKKAEMVALLMDINQGVRKNGVVFTTHNSASRPDFIDIILKEKKKCKILFICDEAHAAGSNIFKKGLLAEYDYRIGLTATPKRMFDEEGTLNLLEYFGNNSFEFSISEAMNTINPLTGYRFLNPYSYHPIFVPLNEKETEEYRKKTKQIIAEKHKKEPDISKIENLYKARARIIKNADGKIEILESLIEKLDPRTMSNTIVFVSDKHLDRVMCLLKQKGARPGKITEDVSAKSRKGVPSERNQEIKAFNKHERGCLVAINCLNEGIDIKNAYRAILLSSSTNEREYIQRIGRVIRYAPGKPVSEIYDFIVLLDDNSLPASEKNRACVIIENSNNEDEVKDLFKQKGIELDGN